ncbi:MAG TPA: 3-oxoacyl-ACP reductase [Planctomycetaceae bacterium]|nr:3-oxoacyl-ACP reductase [Planctomycetaceae bacterium]HCD00551.1 3-oxoacyl-ACP reductase [Planctomycetaceae bacterium]|tara:strand:- start:1504 stop:2301 length:798 start_codon:yes stop_codon:yes gene_type:complete
MGERLKDKVALVTGAGSSGPGWGNGKATAVLFAREGARVCVIDINRDAVEETAGIIRDEGGECLVDQVDVTDAEQVAAVVAKCVDHWGRVDILHNNVGILDVGGPVDASLESWERVVSVNLTSMFLTCKYVLPVMEAQGGGAIVNIASIAGIRYLGIPYVSYSATKGGVLQLTQSVALEYAERGVRVNSILPGLMNTPMIVEPLKGVYADGDVEKMIQMRNEQVPMKTMGDAWDVAHAALFLASDEARYITGAQLVVDGGLTCKC